MNRYLNVAIHPNLKRIGHSRNRLCKIITIRDILGGERLSGREYKAKLERYKMLEERHKRIEMIQRKYPRGNRQPRIEYMRKIQKQPDFKQDLLKMKKLFYSNKGGRLL